LVLSHLARVRINSSSPPYRDHAIFLVIVLCCWAACEICVNDKYSTLEQVVRVCLLSSRATLKKRKKKGFLAYNLFRYRNLLFWQKMAS
jgi:hypothetical protein